MTSWWDQNPFPHEPWCVWDDEKGWMCKLCNKETGNANSHPRGAQHKLRLEWWHGLTPEEQWRLAQEWGTTNVFLRQASAQPAAQHAQEGPAAQTVITVPSDAVVVTRPADTSDMVLLGWQLTLDQANAVVEQLVASIQASQTQQTAAVSLTNGDATTGTGPSASSNGSSHDSGRYAWGM